MSAENSTLPSSLTGALSMSVMIWLAGSLGSTAKYALPTMRSYGPVLPNGRPLRTSVRSETSTRNSAAERIGQTQKNSIPVRFNMETLKHTRDPPLHEGSGLGGEAVAALKLVELDVVGPQSQAVGIEFGDFRLVELVLAAGNVE